MFEGKQVGVFVEGDVKKFKGFKVDEDGEFSVILVICILINFLVR